MIKIGINGFGRIGKCIFMQLIHNLKFSINCINTTSIKVKEIEEYLKYDSTHHYDKNFSFEIISDTEFKINHHKIKLFSDRDPKNLPWDTYGCEYLFECTGSFLTTDKCTGHNVKYVIISSPAKDSTPTFIYGVNHEKYLGETIVSGSSCTTNCLAPMLKLLNDNFKINHCIFTTIHATTASQYTVDIVDKKARTSRSIFNNIIPHTTGASSSVYSVLPELKGLVSGTSLRVPVLNCSLVDLNVFLDKSDIKLSDIIEKIKSNKYFDQVYKINQSNLVSCDFITTTTPTILDVKASIDIGSGKFKLMIWYDNEWSYSAQLVRLCEQMYGYNNLASRLNSNIIIKSKQLNSKYYIPNINFESKNVLLRLDLNVPMSKTKSKSELESDSKPIITDDFRISSAIPTIKTILDSNPSRLIITSHFGRPKGWDKTYSLSNILECLESHIGQPVEFLKDGISDKTLSNLEKIIVSSGSSGSSGSLENPKIFLLENLRFHSEETDYDDSLEKWEQNEIFNQYSNLADIFISDAFGCTHRGHLSISGIKRYETKFNKTIGYGHLINKEINSISKIVNPDKKILCVVGGNKIADKLPIINSFKNLPNGKIYVCGGLAKHYVSEPTNTNIFVMEDGWGNTSLDLEPKYISNIKDSSYNAYDIGPKSKAKLFDLVSQSDIVFWNGSLGVIEHNFYKNSSLEMVKFLESNNQINTIIGGGETGSIVDNKTSDSNIYVSTGGGALLEYLENQFANGSNTPGIKIYE
jgi:glyceraldehyde 3-phosphate dehydrogenase